MAHLPTFATRPAPATVTGSLRLVPAGRCAWLVMLAGAKLGRVRLIPSRDGAPAAWGHGASFAEFTTPEAAAANLYATRYRRAGGTVRSL